MLRYFPNLVFCFHFRWTNASCHANDTLFLGFFIGSQGRNLFYASFLQMAVATSEFKHF